LLTVAPLSATRKDFLIFYVGLVIDAWRTLRSLELVRDVQNGLTREKRCTGVSPSAPVSRAKSLRSHNLDAPSRRGLSFSSSGISSATSMLQSTPDSASQPSQVG
jgi:hypothetical protein